MQVRGRRVLGCVALAALLGAFAASGAWAVHGDVSKYILFGTATKAVSPTDPRDQVISTSEDAANGVFGGATRTLHMVVDSFDGRISLDYYLVNRSCGLGSPRIELAIDTTGDGVPDGNAFGYIGPPPNFNTCNMNTWRSENMTDDQLRWDLTQFGGPFYNTWSMVKAFFRTKPAEEVITGSLVDDNGSAPGSAYFDTVRIGDLVLENWNDTTR